MCRSCGMHNLLNGGHRLCYPHNPLRSTCCKDQSLSARACHWTVFCTRQSYIPQTEQGLHVKIRGVCMQGQLACLLTRHHPCFARQLHMLGCHMQDVLGPPAPESYLLHRMRAGALSTGAIHLEEAAPTAVAAGVSTDPCEVREQAAKTM